MTANGDEGVKGVEANWLDHMTQHFNNGASLVDGYFHLGDMKGELGGTGSNWHVSGGWRPETVHSQSERFTNLNEGKNKKSLESFRGSWYPLLSSRGPLM